MTMLRVLLFGFLCFCGTRAAAPDSLRLVHVVFRHGDRSPTKTFPTDPHRKDSWPQGFEQLTQLGMRQEYKIGQLLRRYYDGFLNSTYIRQELYVQTTEFDRVLMSAEAALAALYPPSGHQVWNGDIPWQPIPVHTVPLSMDKVLHISFPCARYTELRNEALQTEEIRKFQTDNADILHTIRTDSGMEKASFIELLETIPDALFAESQHDMKLAEWVTPEIYNFTFEMQNLYLRLCVYNAEMVKLHGGRWLYEVLSHMQNYTTGKLDHRMRMFMYGGHDSSITTYLSGMKIYDQKLVPYSSFFMLELHEMDDNYYVRVLYKNDTNDNFEAEPTLMEFPGCPDPCPLAEYKKLVLPLLVSTDEEHDRLCEDALV